MNAREALLLAEENGAQVEHVRRTGEIRIRFPDGTVVLIQHPRRRKDANGKLRSKLQQLLRANGKDVP